MAEGSFAERETMTSQKIFPQNTELKTNRELLENEFQSRSFQQEDIYILYRSSNRIIEILGAFTDILNADMLKNKMNRNKDGWFYDYLDNDSFFCL